MTRIFFDLSAYNLYRAATVAASARLPTLSLTASVPEANHSQREWSRVPISSSRLDFHRRMVQQALDNGGLPDNLLAQVGEIKAPVAPKNIFNTFIALVASATSGLVYCEPPFADIFKDDPRHPQYAYIKCAHGTAGPGTPDQYPIQDYIRPALTALSAGWGISPYHFYYMDMVARDQMSCFINSIAAACAGDLRLFGTGDPVIDLEDNTSQTYRSFYWDGVSDPSRAIANAKFFLGTVFKLALETCDALFGAKLGRPVLTRVYSGWWFWKPIMALLMLERPGGGYWPEHQQIFDFYNKRLAINAWYTNDHQPAPLTNEQRMPMIQNVARQYASAAVPPVVHWPVAGMDGVLGSSIDQNLWLGDEASYQKFIGVPLLPIGTEPPPPDLETRIKALEDGMLKAEADVALLQADVTALQAVRDRVKSALN